MKRNYIKDNLFLLLLFLTSICINSCQKINSTNENSGNYNITSEEVKEVLKVTHRSFKHKDLEILQNELLNSKPVIHLKTLGDTLVKYVVPVLNDDHTVKGYLSFTTDAAFTFLQYEILDSRAIQHKSTVELGEAFYLFETMQKNGYKLNSAIENLIVQKKIDKSNLNAQDTNGLGKFVKKSAAKAGSSDQRCTAIMQVQFAGVGSVCNPGDFNILAEHLTQKIREYFSNKGGQAYFENHEIKVIAPDLWEFNFQNTAQDKIISLMQYNIPIIPCIGSNTNPRVTYYSKWCTGEDPEEPFPGEDGGSGGGSNQSPEEIDDYLSPEQQQQLLINRICPQSFAFTSVVEAGSGLPGWKEASLKGVTVNTIADSYFENIWTVVTTGTPIVSSTFNLEIGVSGDRPSTQASLVAAEAANTAMNNILKKYSYKAVKRQMELGKFPVYFIAEMVLQIKKTYPEATVSSNLSGRTVAKTPMTGCQ